MLCISCSKMKLAELSTATFMLLCLSVLLQRQCHAGPTIPNLKSDCLSIVSQRQCQRQCQRQYHASPAIPNLKFHGVAGYESAQVMRDGDTSGGDISFETPDIIVDDYEKHYQLKAYKHVGNDKITDSDAPAEKASMLQWVSVGYPTLLLTSEIGNMSNVKLFHFDDEGFYTYVQMLTEVDRHRLALRASSRYNVNVSDEQIINLMLSTFTCSLRISSENYKGAVTRFSDNPLQMHFSAPENSNNRRVAHNVYMQALVIFLRWHRRNFLYSSMTTACCR